MNTNLLTVRGSLAILTALAVLMPAAAMAQGGSTPGGWDKVKGKRVLYFTKSAGFEHSVVKRPSPGELSHSEKVLTELGKQHGFEVVCTKDGSVFTPENLAKYDVIALYTSGNLFQAGTDKAPPMTPEGKAALVSAVRDGKGVVAFHAATDSFRNERESFIAHGDKVDAYIALIGGEFIRHGPQQKAKAIVVDRAFPGNEKLGESYEVVEEWYTFKDFVPDMHVIQLLDTKGMKGIDYQRAPFPYTWARKEGKGRVFYTGHAHREDVWSGPLFQDILLGGLGWAAGNVDADVTPNLKEAAPGYAEIQRER